MSFFKNQEYALALSPIEVNNYLNKITRQKGQKKGWNYHLPLFKGYVQPNIFHISINHYFQPVSVIGTIKPDNLEKSKIQLSGKFVWHNVLINTVLFMGVSAMLLLLCFLLIQEDWKQGLFASVCSLILSFALYRSLIGGMRKYYLKVCSDLVRALNVAGSVKSNLTVSDKRSRIVNSKK